MHTRVASTDIRCLVLTEDSVGGVPCRLVHGSVADEPPGVSECDAGRRGEVALVVGDDLDAVVRRAPHGHAGVGRPEVDADRRPVALRARHLRAIEPAGKRKDEVARQEFRRPEDL